MNIQRINNAKMKRIGVNPAKDYFKQDVPGWVMENAGGCSYYPPSEWEAEPEYAILYVRQEDMPKFGPNLSSPAGGWHLLSLEDTSTVLINFEKPS